MGTSGGLASGIAAVLKAADPSIQVWGAHPQVVQRLRAILTAPKAGWEGGAEEVPAGMVDEFVSVTEEEVRTQQGGQLRCWAEEGRARGVAPSRSPGAGMTQLLELLAPPALRHRWRAR